MDYYRVNSYSKNLHCIESTAFAFAKAEDKSLALDTAKRNAAEAVLKGLSAFIVDVSGTVLYSVQEVRENAEQWHATANL